jgi:hypothetical protein
MLHEHNPSCARLSDPIRMADGGHSWGAQEPVKKSRIRRQRKPTVRNMAPYLPMEAVVPQWLMEAIGSGRQMSALEMIRASGAILRHCAPINAYGLTAVMGSVPADRSTVWVLNVHQWLQCQSDRVLMSIRRQAVSGARRLLRALGGPLTSAQLRACCEERDGLESVAHALEIALRGGDADVGLLCGLLDQVDAAAAVREPDIAAVLEGSGLPAVLLHAGPVWWGR